MNQLKSKTGKVHIGLNNTIYGGVLCNSSLGPMKFYNHYTRYGLTETVEGVTCKSCLKIAKKHNLYEEESSIVEVHFGSKINSIKTFFETKAEKNAYIKGIKDSQNWHRVEIDGRLV